MSGEGDASVLTIDGEDGGGQVLRTALSLAVATDTAFEVENVRGGRPNPGLRPQHLAAVELAAVLCDAEVAGDELESDELTFRPGDERRSSLEATIETAGSVALLFDTLLPVAAADGEALRVTATGGTDVKWAPTVAYLQHVKLPLLARWGLDAGVTLDRTGFYPAGGGEATLDVAPSSLSRIDLYRRGDLGAVEVHSKAAESLATQEVADRQADRSTERLADAGHPVEVRSAEYVPTDSPGSALLLRAVYAESIAGFDALGERGRPSEDVADGAVDAFADFHASDAPVDSHVADQLMVYLALVGGRVRIPRVTEHVETNLAVLSAFGSEVALDRNRDGLPVLSASAHPSID